MSGSTFPGRAHAAVLAAALLAAALPMVAACTGREADKPPPCRIAQPPARASPTVGGSAVSVVEQGYTRILSSADDKVSMGAVVRNDGNRVAYRTLIRFDVLDPAGNSLIWEPHRRFMAHEVPVILPRTAVAVGSALSLFDAVRGERSTVDRVLISATVGGWLGAGDGSVGLGAVTTRVISGRGERDKQGTGSVGIVVQSANCGRMVSRGSSMIFRDRSGRIVGGSLNTFEFLYTCESGRYETMVGTGLRSIPEGADLDRTEVTQYCDYDRPPRPSGTGGPVN